MEIMTVNEVELVPPKTLNLIRSAQEGNQQALEQAVAENMGLVHLALIETNAGQDDDLRQEAVIGLIKAIDGYNLQSHWLAYSMRWIKGAIGRARQADRLMPMDPTHADGPVQVAQSLRLMRDALSVAGQEPSLSVVAEKVGVDEQLALRITGADTPYAPLEPDAFSVIDPGYEDVELRYECDAYLSSLSEVEHEVVARFFGLDGYDEEPMPAIAEHFGISTRQAYHIKDRAMSRMREGLEVA